MMFVLFFLVAVAHMANPKVFSWPHSIILSGL